MLNDKEAQNYHHQSYNEYINRDGNSYCEDMVERVVHNSNMLAKMIGLMIHNQEIWLRGLFEINTILIVSKTSIGNAVVT